MDNFRKNIMDGFKNKEYRHGYVDEFLSVHIATQIKVLREQRGWNQKELAQKADMKQPRVSVMENVNYASWNIKTLRRIAEAFDLTLRVSFESFGDRLNDVLKFGRESLERCSFDEDHVFKDKDIDESHKECSMNITNEKIPVTMKFNKSTVEKVNNLIELTRITNRAQIVAQAIHIYNFIEKSRRNDKGKIYIEYPDGTRERFVNKNHAILKSN